MLRNSEIQVFKSIRLVLICILTLTFSSLAYGQSCNSFLSANQTILSQFLERSQLEPLNIFSNPLEMYITNDPALNISVQRSKEFSGPIIEGPIINGHTRTSGKFRRGFDLPVAESKVFDLKYVVFESANSITALSKSYRNIESMPLGKELLLAKPLLEKNAELRILLTDAGLSVWTKSQLNQWLSDYSINSLSPTMMSEFIYRSAQDPHFRNSVSQEMALKVSRELDNVKQFEISNKEDILMFNEGLEVNSISFFYRSLFRESLLNQRLEFLNQIGKTTEFTKLSPEQRQEALQTLAFFPEFLYQAEQVARTRFNPEYALAEGGLVFASTEHGLKFNSNFNVAARMWRAVDDAKIETLHMGVFITKNRSHARFSPQELALLKHHIEKKWEEVQTTLKPSLRIKAEDLRFEVEKMDTEGYVLNVNISRTLAQHGLEPYLVFGLFNQLY